MSAPGVRPDISLEDLDFIDQLIDDYLLFRGFTATKKEFFRERKGDKNKKYQVRHRLSPLCVALAFG